MAADINIEKLREEVNPVYSTAHSCLQIVAATGDVESAAKTTMENNLLLEKKRYGKPLLS